MSSVFAARAAFGSGPFGVRVVEGRWQSSTITMARTIAHGMHRPSSQGPKLHACNYPLAADAPGRGSEVRPLGVTRRSRQRARLGGASLHRAVETHVYAPQRAASLAAGQRLVASRMLSDSVVGLRV